MKLTIKHIIPCLVAALSLASCDDWTDVEALDVIDPTIENTNPELYAKYLAALRQYKQTEHKVTYAWFDNSVKNTYSRAHHVSDVPDSVDVISLMSPADIMDTELAEIKQVREQKGTRFIYDIDFDAIRADYNSYIEQFAAENPDGEEEPVAINDYLLEAISTQLSYCSRYEFDGICYRFTGKHTLHLTKDELNEYLAQAGIFAGYLMDWHRRNADKMLVDDSDDPFTAHTTNVVPLVVMGAGDVKLREGGVLADLAPTMLELMGLPQPAEMTGRSMIVK